MTQAADIPLQERYQLMRDFQGTTRYEPSSPPGVVPDDPDPDEDDDPGV